MGRAAAAAAGRDAAALPPFADCLSTTDSPGDGGINARWGGKRPFFPETTTRNLADLAALLERQSPLGLCLRRSLIRFHYLRQLNIPVVVLFGAKLVPGKQQKEIAGHAWLTLQDAPYYEAEENWRDFTVMFTWPKE